MNTTPLPPSLRIPAVLAGLALGLLLTGCTTATPDAEPQGVAQATATAQPTEETAAEPTAVVRTAFPDLEAPEGEPELESIADARPAPGEVVQAEGPFDQRIVLEDLVFDGTGVSGEVVVTSDISELLALQVLAGFYDEQGNLLGTDRFDHEPDAGHTHGGPSEPEEFAIMVPPEFADRAVSAAVGVPVLVNE